MTDELWLDEAKKLQSEEYIVGTIQKRLEYGYVVQCTEKITGFVHIKDLSWGRVKENNFEFPSVGDKIKVKILEIQESPKSITLGHRQVFPNPWKGAAKRYPEDTIVRGTVFEIVDYGLFVELEKDVYGIVYCSELDWVNRNIHPSRCASLGDKIDVMVLDVNEDQQRIHLGLKQTQPNPYQQIADNHQPGDSIPVIVSGANCFMIYVRFPNGAEGPVFESDLGHRSVDSFVKGEELLVRLDGVDVERERIQLALVSE